MMKISLCIAFGLLLASSTWAQSQEREWSLDATEREAFLVFGVPNTDDVGLSFWCEIGSKKMSAYLPASFGNIKHGEKTTMNILVDGKQFKIPAKAAREGEGSKFTVEGHFTATDKLVASLQDAQEVAIAIKGHTAAYPMTDADFPGLLSACRGEIGSN